MDFALPYPFVPSLSKDCLFFDRTENGGQSFDKLRTNGQMVLNPAPAPPFVLSEARSA